MLTRGSNNDSDCYCIGIRPSQATSDLSCRLFFMAKPSLSLAVSFDSVYFSHYGIQAQENDSQPGNTTGNRNWYIANQVQELVSLRIL